ncbi:MAG: HPr family phosphocarrier protein [Gemmatales bacterium]
MNECRCGPSTNCRNPLSGGFACSSGHDHRSESPGLPGRSVSAVPGSQGDARNVFDMFLLGAEKGALIKLEASEAGDAEAALETLAALFAPDCPEMKLPEE